MLNRHLTRGFTLPSLWQLLVAGAAVSGGWLLWTGFRERHVVPDVTSTTNLVEDLQRAEKLADLGSDGVPALTDELSDANPRIRRNALFVLARVGPDARPALANVRERLADVDARVRINAMDAFWRINRDAAEVVAAVAPLLADGDSQVRLEAEKTLRAIGVEAAQPLISVLQNDTPATRIGALRVLRGIDNSEPATEVCEAVRGLVADPDRQTQLQALAALALWGVARDAEIRDLLHSEGIEVEPVWAQGPQGPRKSVDIALEGISRRGPSALELLPDVVALFDDERFLRQAASPIRDPQAWFQQGGDRPLFHSVLRALESMQDAARPAVPELLRVALRADSNARFAIARVLHSADAEPSQVSSLLVPLLIDDGSRNSWQAGELLTKVSPDEARRQVSLLLPQLSGANGSVNRRVLNALCSLGSQAGEAVPDLIKLVKKREDQVFKTAVFTLGKIGPAAEPAIPALVATLGRTNITGEERYAIIRALGKIGPSAQDAVPALLGIINRPMKLPAGKSPVDPDSSWNDSLREAALEALTEIGQSAPPVLQAFRTQLTFDSPSVRATAAKCLATLAGDSPTVVDDLARLLDDAFANVRAHAALAIGKMTADRHAVVPRLARTLADESPYVCTAAAMALQTIGSEAKSALPALRASFDEEANALPNIRRRQSNLAPEMVVYIPELDQSSVAKAVRAAIAAIETGEQ